MLKFAFNWKKLSALAGVPFWNFYFRLFEGAIKGPQVITFLQHLLPHLPGRLWIVWDAIAIHRSRLVKDFLATEEDRLRVERLPAYAPELNPRSNTSGVTGNNRSCPTCAPVISGI